MKSDAFSKKTYNLQCLMSTLRFNVASMRPDASRNALNQDLLNQEEKEAQILTNKEINMKLIAKHTEDKL